MMRKARKRVRLISGEDAIGAITNYAKFLRDNFHEPCNLTGMIDAIEALPTIDPVRWIPCKDRLPEVGRNVLMSVGKGLYTAEGELKYDGTWVQYRWSANIENVDAWAEMPEPWRGEEDE